MNDFTGSLIVWLRPQLAPAEIAGKMPNVMPAEFVRLARIGGPYVFPIVDTPTVAVEAWAATEAAAHTLIQKVRRLIWSLRGGTLNGMAVYVIEEFAGPAYLPDPDREGRPRFVLTVSVQHREEMTA